jgi:hypothetical protein
VYNIVCMFSVFLLIIGVQYCMNVVCSSLDYRCTILYECCLCSSLDYRWTILYECCHYRQHSYNIVHLESRKLQTTFIQYCTPIIKRTTDNIHTILYTYNQENYRQNSYNIVHLLSSELKRQHSYNIVHL